MDAPGPPPTPSAGDASDSPPPLADIASLKAEQRVSFYVQAVDEMVDAVLENESFLFSEDEVAALRRFREMQYQSRYLFSRLLLRKSVWIRHSSLLNSASYTNDISDLPAACAELCQTVAGPSPNSKEEESKPVLGVAKEEVEVKKEENGVIDLTLSDTDDEKPTAPFAPSPTPTRSAKAKGKGKAVITPAPTVLPRTLVPPDSPDDLPDLSHFALDVAALTDEKPETILGLLSMEELVGLGKKMKVSVKGGATRGEWTKALLRTSSQSTLSFFALAQPPQPPSPSSPTGSSSMERKASLGSLGVGYDSKGNKLTQSSVVARHALKIIGPVIRLSPTFLLLFSRLSLVYHRTSYLASNNPYRASPLTASLLARFGKRHYPSYTVSRSFALFPSRHVLREFEAAIEIERELEECLEGVWGPGVPKRSEKETSEERLDRYRRGVAVWESIEAEWRRLCEEAECEMKSEEDDEEKRRLYYRRRFHPGWPLSRAAYKAAACYAKLGDHDSEVRILRYLLAQTSFRRGKRGDWYDRLALVLMNHPLGAEKALSSSSEVKEELKGKKKERKEKFVRERKEEAMKVCEAGLEDPYTHLIYKSSLQRRISRIESALAVPPEDRRTFPVLLAKSAQRLMQGERIDTPTIGKKSIWQRSDGEECSVEELCLEHFHSENGVLTMIFALTFWDILFATVDGVFETPFQTAPLDLATDAFAIVRRPAITDRLASIAAGQAVKLLSETDDRERPLATFAVGTNWDKYSKEDLVEIIECIGGPALAAILTVFVEEYGHRTGGIPDLWFVSPSSLWQLLWNPSKSQALFAEIKGPGDQLSETQKVWIDVLLGAGVGVEVVRVVESKDMKEESAEDGSEDEEDGDEQESQKLKRKKGKKRRSSESDGNGRARSRSKSAAKGGRAKRAKKEETAEAEDVMVLDDTDD
ncbi:hypothetical protein JCM10020v2_000956 [Rhodotorula toruloides]